MEKTISKTTIEKKGTSPNNKKDRYFEVKLPRLSFKETNVNFYLSLALVIAAFLIGLLTNKVIVLQSTLKAQAANGIGGGLINNGRGLNNNPPPIPTLPAKVDVAPGHLPIQGSDTAKVTVVEFSDFQCPFCERFFSETYAQLNDTYIKTNKIKFTYRHYPLNSIHPNAQKAAEASECANEQNKFWEYHDLLFKNQTTWSPLDQTTVVNSFTDYAGQIGLDSTQFRSCLDSEKYKKNVDDDATDGSKAGVDGTPAFFINGTRLVGAQPFAVFQQLIEQELKK